MMLYRHFDLKKYINIKIEKGLAIKTVIIFTFSIILFFQKNIYLDIINLLVVCIYAFILNKSFLTVSIKTIIKKLKK